MPAALELATALWISLLAILPPPPASMRPCLARGAEAIPRAAAEAAAAYDVPVGVLLVVAWLESHAGCDRASGGCWGAPVNARHRLTAGRASHAASALSLGFRGGARSRGRGPAGAAPPCAAVPAADPRGPVNERAGRWS